MAVFLEDSTKEEEIDKLDDLEIRDSYVSSEFREVIYKGVELAANPHNPASYYQDRLSEDPTLRGSNVIYPDRRHFIGVSMLDNQGYPINILVGNSILLKILPITQDNNGVYTMYSNTHEGEIYIAPNIPLVINSDLSIDTINGSKTENADPILVISAIGEHRYFTIERTATDPDLSITVQSNSTDRRHPDLSDEGNILFYYLLKGGLSNTGISIHPEIIEDYGYRNDLTFHRIANELLTIGIEVELIKSDGRYILKGKLKGSNRESKSEENSEPTYDLAAD